MKCFLHICNFVNCALFLFIDLSNHAFLTWPVEDFLFFSIPQLKMINLQFMKESQTHSLMLCYTVDSLPGASYSSRKKIQYFLTCYATLLDILLCAPYLGVSYSIGANIGNSLERWLFFNYLRDILFSFLKKVRWNDSFFEFWKTVKYYTKHSRWRFWIQLGNLPQYVEGMIELNQHFAQYRLFWFGSSISIFALVIIMFYCGTSD